VVYPEPTRSEPAASVGRVLPIVDVSQHGEASVLATIVEDDWPRYLVDVGAHDGHSLSNSFPFLSLGWSGVLVEPLPAAFERLAALHASRDDVRCVQAACGDGPGRSSFSVGRDGPLPMTSRLGGGDGALEVDVRTVTSVLDEAGAPSDFSLLLVDTEGADGAVLAGLDFDRYRPRVVVTEDDVAAADAHAAKEALLRERGYVLFSVVAATNSIWIAREHAPAGEDLPLSPEATVERVGAAAWARRCAELERSRDEIWQQLVVLQSSRSWRLTRPLRRLAERRR
jgi:FkbM family methyltransferase